MDESPHVSGRVAVDRHWEEGSICAANAPTVSYITGYTDRHYGHGTRLSSRCQLRCSEIRTQWNACSTYNLLAEEGRHVAAALLPLEANVRPWKITASR